MKNQRMQNTTSQTKFSFFVSLIFLRKLVFCNAFLASSSSFPQRKNAFVIPFTRKQLLSCQDTPNRTHRYMYAPKGSGYVASDDETPDRLPSTYKPQLGYPGTMRPGKSGENQSYSSLPIADDDPEPVPWPHFQEVEWHHRWTPPHDHPIPMEEFIDMQGRWATVEMEAEVRKDARRGVRERKELEEAKKVGSFILDDDEDDEDDEDDGEDKDEDEEVIIDRDPMEEIKLDLGDDVDVEKLLESEIESAVSGVNTVGANSIFGEVGLGEGTEEDDDDEDDDDDFLIDLGLDGDGEDNTNAIQKDSGDQTLTTEDEILDAMQGIIDIEENGEGPDDGGVENDSDIDLNFNDLGLELDGDVMSLVEEDNDFSMNVMDEDDNGMDGMDVTEDDQMIPLDDMIGDEDMGDDDAFDDGGFDYD